MRCSNIVKLPGSLCAAEWRWLCVAANGGHVDAQVELGHYWQFGIAPVAKDWVRAYMWYRLATAGGSERAPTDADELRPRLTAARRAEAERQ